MGRLRAACCVFVLAAGTSMPLCSVAQTAHSQSHGTRCSVPQQEIAVFRTYLESERSRPNVVLTTTYTHHDFDVDSLNLQLAAQGRGMPPDLREDFKRKNRGSCNIEPFEGIDRLSFLAESEHNQIFKQGWNKFHERFGKKASLVTLSRVGFNKEHTLALLHVSSGIDRMAAGGELCLFERKQNKWALKTRVQTWAT